MIRWQFLLPKGCNWKMKLRKEGARKEKVWFLPCSVLLVFCCICGILFPEGPCCQGKRLFCREKKTLCLFPDNQVQTCKSGGLQERSWMNDSCLLMLINAAPAKSLTLWDSKKKHQTCPSPPVWIYMVAKCSLTPLYRNTCSCFSVLQRMLLRSIISENFKACQKHSPLEHAAASKCTYIFQMDRKRPSLVLRWC